MTTMIGDKISNHFQKDPFKFEFNRIQILIKIRGCIIDVMVILISKFLMLESYTVT